MAYTKGTLEHGGDVLLPKTTLDQLYASDGSTAIVAGGTTNIIGQDFLPVSGEEMGIIKVNTGWNTYGVRLSINAGTVSLAGKAASASNFGFVRVDTSASNGVSLAVSDGTISASAQYASTNAFGVVMVPSGATNGVSLNISDGVLRATGVLAQSNAFGVVRAGSYVTINDGVLSVDLADTELGSVKPGAVYVNQSNGGHGISLELHNGELNVSVDYANKNQFGTVKIGDNIDVTYDDGVHEDGIISVPLAGTSTAGVVTLASSIGESTTNVVTEVLVKNAVDNLQEQITNITGTTVADLQNQISDITGTTVVNLQGQLDDITGTTVSNLQGQIDSITGTTVTDLQNQISAITGTTVTDLQNQINGKQGTLSAGAGIELNGNVISTTSVMKIMTTAERTAITPEAGQVIYDSTLGQLFLGDGFTPGGTIIGAGGGGGSVTPGYRMTDDGTYLNFNPVMPIVDTTGSNTITLNPDTAYKIIATGGAVTLNANAPAAGSWGYEGHAEIFVAGTGYVVTGTNVVLANALEPDAVNNCVLRFHDGTCIIDVEDHVYGYIVTAISGTTSGTLPYGITSATSNYIAFDATTNGSTINLSGATASAEKHIVGNGYTSTTLTGAVDCGTSKFTVANLTLSDVQITGGTLTLGDAYIPSGSTVAVSGGGLAVERVSGNDSVIDLGGTQLPQKTSANIKGCTITNGYGQYGGMVYLSGGVINASNCSFVGNVASAQGGVVYAYDSSFLTFDSCVISGNSTQAQRAGAITFTGSGKLVMNDCVVTDNTAAGGAYNAGGILTLAPTELNRCLVSGNIGSGAGKDMVVRGTTVTLTGSTVADIQMTSGGSLVLKERNTIEKVTSDSSTLVGTVTLTNGAILDLTDNSNPTPIAPGGGITFEQGEATIYPSAGSVSAATVGVTGGTFTAASISNTATLTVNKNVSNITAMTLRNCSIVSTASELYWSLSENPEATRIMTFENCTFDCPNNSIFYIGVKTGTINIKNCTFLHSTRPWGQSSQSVTLNMAGNIYTHGIQGDIAFSAEVVNIADGTYLDASDCESSYLMRGTITFGSGVKIKKYGTTEYVDLVEGGTSGTCYIIARNGSITYSA